MEAKTDATTLEQLIMGSMYHELSSTGYDSVMDDSQLEALGYKNLCAQVPPGLLKNVEFICSELGISKQRLIVDSLSHAVSMFSRLADESGYSILFNEDEK